MMVRGATELETHVVSLERIKEYSEVDSEVSMLPAIYDADVIHMFYK